MKVVLFCGGEGTRIREASESLPKPLISLGGLPIMFHVMCEYARAGCIDFILCAGYKIEKIIEFSEKLKKNFEGENFSCDAWVALGYPPPSDWKVKVVDTGSVCIGERLWSIRHMLMSEDFFYANYSDAISNVSIEKSLKCLLENDSICSFMAVKPSQSYHWIDFNEDGTVGALNESTKYDKRINGGYMCLTPNIFDYLYKGEELVLESFERLIKLKKLSAYKFDGYWKSIDTYKDLMQAESEINEKYLSGWSEHDKYRA